MCNVCLLKIVDFTAGGLSSLTRYYFVSVNLFAKKRACAGTVPSLQNLHSNGVKGVCMLYISKEVLLVGLRPNFKKLLNISKIYSIVNL